MPRLCIGSNAVLGDLISIPTKTVHLVKHEKDATGTNTGTNVNDNTNDNANINACDKAVLLSVDQVSFCLEEGLDWEEHDYQLQLHQQSNANANGNVQPESPVVLNICDDGIPLRCTAPSPVPTPNSNNNGNNNGDRGSESDTDDSSDDDDTDDTDGMVSTGSILGIHENQSLFSARRRKNEQGLVMKDEKDLTLHLEVFRPNLDADAVVDANTDTNTNTNIANHNPHCDWTRRPRKIVSNVNANDDDSNCNNDANGTSSLQLLPDAKMRLFDLTNLQNHRMQKNDETNMSNGTHNGTHNGTSTRKRNGTCKHDTGVGTDNINFQIDSPGYICHLLRSILQYSYSDADTNNNGNDNDENNIDADPHFASPWSSRYYVDTNKNSNTNTDAMNTNTSKTSCYQTDLVIGILLKNQLNENNDSSLRSNLDDMNLGINNTSRHKNAHKNNHHWNTLEKRELTELSKFRTGDACPSFYLYSMSKLRSDFNIESLLVSRGNDEGEGEGVLSEVLEHANENNINENGDSGSSIRSSSGYTLFVYRQMPPRDHFVDQLSGGRNVESHSGCLLEEKRFPTSNPTSSSSDEANYRIVAPPYQSHEDVYPGLMKDLFLNPETLKLVTLEAQKIPQWTAWPEKNHYQSEYDNNTDLSDNAYPASWTVFPLCHTFPATDISARKWIGKTCALVPQTTALLKALGPMLRTALFSRLEPRTTLELHTGWADLANHVLRVHIPLVVPSGGVNTGLCGTWVDGCVETHKEGEIICFDDSKTHRAFNYSDEERIVLIVDLARPSDQGFPEGTASGGYTNELDAFIKQFS